MYDTVVVDEQQSFAFGGRGGWGESIDCSARAKGVVKMVRRRTSRGEEGTLGVGGRMSWRVVLSACCAVATWLWLVLVLGEDDGVANAHSLVLADTAARANRMTSRVGKRCTFVTFMATLSCSNASFACPSSWPCPPRFHASAVWFARNTPDARLVHLLAEANVSAGDGHLH